jgi:hypothetical protein
MQMTGTLQTTTETTNLNPALGTTPPGAPAPDLQAQLTMLMQKVTQLEQEKEQLKAANKAPPKALKLDISEKGVVMVRGLQRFPVSLYRSQWERLLEPGMVTRIQEFIKANASKLERLEAASKAAKAASEATDDKE